MRKLIKRLIFAIAFTAVFLSVSSYMDDGTLQAEDAVTVTAETIEGN